MMEHESKHITDLTEEWFPCDKDKCVFAVQLHCAIVPGNKNDTECSAYCTELTCINKDASEPRCPEPEREIKAAMGKYYRGKGNNGCLK